MDAAEVPALARAAVRLERLVAAERAPLLALGALIAVALVLAALAWLFPELVYYPFVWRYYYGPIVADAAGAPVTRGGVTAFAGYNPANTLTWAAVLAVALWNLGSYFQRRGFTLQRRLVYAFAPMIAAGGTTRALVDADLIPEPIAYLFITPNIYVVFAGLTLLALVAGIELERRGWPRPAVRHWHLVGAAGVAAFAATLIGVAALAADPPAGVLRWGLVLQVVAIAGGLTGLVAVAGRAARLAFAADPLYVFVLFGQLVDGAQNYVGLSQGYASKLLGTSFLVAWLGDAGLLVAKLALFVPALAYIKARVEPDPKVSRNTLMLLLIAFLALGFAMGFHGGVGLLLGV